VSTIPEHFSRWQVYFGTQHVFNVSSCSIDWIDCESCIQFSSQPAVGLVNLSQSEAVHMVGHRATDRVTTMRKNREEHQDTEDMEEAVNSAAHDGPPWRCYDSEGSIEN
jgi:hypothetical protein